jgi:hypothetical protein
MKLSNSMCDFTDLNQEAFSEAEARLYRALAALFDPPWQILGKRSTCRCAKR